MSNPAGVQDLRQQLLQAETDRKDALLILCSQQEERAKALEEMNSRKEEQLVKLHNRLQEALTVLQEGQKMYAQQQQQMDTLQQTIERLCESKAPMQRSNGQAQAAGPAGPSRVAPAARREAARPAWADEEEKSKPKEEEKASGKAEEKARDREAKASDPRQDKGLTEELGDVDINDLLEMDTSEAEQVLSALQALLEEKQQLHQQLLSEQAEAEQRLKALREMGGAP
mmetsp:Transcript_28231/g.45390  ORF Transcript_28231/g.45390 Transcript_28231/m.45390 type:complete len:228 (-) Transcript_28231:60-743(-)